LLRSAVVRRLVAALVTVVAVAGPVLSVAPNLENPAEVEKKAGTLETDELLAPADAPLDLSVAHGIDLGAHGPDRSAPPLPFLEVPEDPPELG
jgi:hypothetical protein